MLELQLILLVIVMNGDLLIYVNFDGMLKFYVEYDVVVIMVVCEYDFQVFYGVVCVDGVKIVGIEEKFVQCFFVNVGIYVFFLRVISMILGNIFFDMIILFDYFIVNKENIVVYLLCEYWFDIGWFEEFE